LSCLPCLPCLLKCLSFYLKLWQQANAC
jgi:hypothetical protein